MKLFDKASFWEQFLIYRDILYILKKLDVRYKQPELYEQSDYFVAYCNRELNYFREIFCYNFDTAELEQIAAKHSLRKDVLKYTVLAIDLMRCHRLMQFVYPGYANMVNSNAFKTSPMMTLDPIISLIHAWLDGKGPYEVLSICKKIKEKALSKKEVIELAVKFLKLFEKFRQEKQNNAQSDSEEGAVLLPVTTKTEKENTQPECQNCENQQIESFREYLTRSDLQGQQAEDIKRTKQLLATYTRIMERKRNISQTERLLRRDVYARVEIEEDNNLQRIEIDPQDAQIAAVLRKIVIYKKTAPKFHLTGNVLNTQKYIAFLAGQNEERLFEHRRAKVKGGKVVFLADASQSMEKYYTLEKRVFSILEYAFRDYIDFELYCFDAPEENILRISRKFFAGYMTPITHALNYVTNRLRIESQKYDCSLIVIFTDMKENVSRYGKFELGLKALHEKTSKMRVKIVAVVPESCFQNHRGMNYIKEFSAYYPVISIEEEYRLTADLIKLLKAIKMS